MSDKAVKLGQELDLTVIEVLIMAIDMYYFCNHHRNGINISILVEI